MKGILRTELQHRSGLSPVGAAGIDSLLVEHLSTKWESRIDPGADFRLFLMMNKSGELLSSATSRFQSAHNLEIWDTSTNAVRDNLRDDFNGVSSMTWRRDDSYYISSHDSIIRYYSDGSCVMT